MNTIAGASASGVENRIDLSSSFSSMVKRWRNLRKSSQLDLALDAGVSQRHVSFLESGRAKPSREMVLCLAEAMELPLRERNLLLNAAGFAPVFKERALDNEEMKSVQLALEMSLAHHEPYPAVVVDRNWNLVMSNESALRLTGFLGDPEQVWQRVDPSGNKNVYRMTFHPEGMQALIKNWDQLAKYLLVRLQREAASDPSNESLSFLFQEVLNFSGIDLTKGYSEKNYPLTPIMPMELVVGDQTLKVFSMVSSFGTALDITAEELKVETFFPADEFTTKFFERFHNNIKGV